MTSTSTTVSGDVPPEVRARVERRAREARGHLGATIDRRRKVHERLKSSPDPDDQAVARVYRDFLWQAEDVLEARAALTLAAAATGDPVIGRLAVFDDERDVALVSWHSPEGTRQLLSDDRLLVSEREDGSLALHTLSADDEVLAGRIRQQMRESALREEMSDPLATLTVEQAAALRAITDARGDILLHGPPGSGKSAIVMVELARRVLSDPHPERFRVLFVTGTPRLARRAEALGRMLGTASITPIPQDDLLGFVGISDDDRVAVGELADIGPHVPAAVEAAFARARGLLSAPDVELPHPLGTVEADDLDCVRRWRAQASSTSYAELAAGLRADLHEEYASIIPGERSRAAADAAADLLRPHLTPSELVAAGTDGARLPRPLQAAAMSVAREMLARPDGRSERSWDLVVVDEYQRLPTIVTWLLRRRAGRVLLSGDPLQSFADATTGGHLPAAREVDLQTSLRMPEAIGRWIDEAFTAHGLSAPRIRCAAGGGTITRPGAPPPDAQVIAPASRVDEGSDWLTPAEAAGLEWPAVAVVAPEQILAEHGRAGLFIAASRAIDTLNLVEA